MEEKLGRERLDRPRIRWQSNDDNDDKLDLRGNGWSDMDWIDLAQDRGQ
jgi:hypothetical protein